MAQFGLLALCLLAGLVLRLTRRLPSNTAVVLNGFIFYLSLPAMILVQFHKIQWSAEIFYPVSVIWLVFVLGFLFASVVGKWARWNPKTIGALVLTIGLGNTSFVGFPLLEALYGPSAIQYGVIVDQLGTFLFLSSFGIAVASFFSATSGRKRSSELFSYFIKKFFSFPPVYALILATLTRSVYFPDALNQILIKLGTTITPLALVSVGFQLRIDPKSLKAQMKPLAFGLMGKLVIIPLLLSVFYLKFLKLSTFSTQVALVESAMAPMITAAVVAAEYQLNAELANLMVGVGIPLSLATVPLWKMLIHRGLW